MTSLASQESKTRLLASKVIMPRLLRLALLVVVDAAMIWFISRSLSLGYYPLVAVTVIIAVLVNYILLRQEAYPLRWMVVGLVLMIMFTIYPIFFTVWVSFTNYGEGHLITKTQALDQILKAKYLPATGLSYTWTAYKTPEGVYALWLKDANGNGYLALVGKPLDQPKPGEMGLGELDESGIPKSIKGYQRLNAILAATDKNLTEIQFGESGKTIQVRYRDAASQYAKFLENSHAQSGSFTCESRGS